MSCSRVAMNATAFAFPFTARSMTGGAFKYSANRSSQVLRTAVCTRTILPVISPAFLKSASCPSPTSTIGTCFTAASAGAHATETARTRNDESTVPPPTFVASTCNRRRCHLGCAFRPRRLNREPFGVNAVGAGGCESLHSPRHRVLHRGSPGTRVRPPRPSNGARFVLER